MTSLPIPDPAGDNPRSMAAALPEKPSNVRQGPWLEAVKPEGQDEPGLSTRQKVHRRFLAMLGRDDPPELVAASFALGVFISFTPLFGLHLVMALSLAFLLRLKKMDVVLGTLVVNPLTFAPVAAAAVPIGRFLMRADGAVMESLPWKEFASLDFWRDAGPAMTRVLIQWGVGMFALSVLAGVATYAVLLRILRARRRHRLAMAQPAVRPAGPRDGGSGSPE